MLLKSCVGVTFPKGAKKNMLLFMPILKLYSPVDLCAANNFSKFDAEADLLYILVYTLVCYTLIFTLSSISCLGGFNCLFHL